MRNKTGSHNAFTLLELLMVVLIIAASASVALPNFSRFVKNVEFNTAAEGLVSNIRFGQLRALTQGKGVQVRIQASGYWLEEERFMDHGPVSDPLKPVFERLKGRHGRISRFPDGVILRSSEAVVSLSPDGRIRSPKIELCRQQKCLAIEITEMIGQLQVTSIKEGMPDGRL